MFAQLVQLNRIYVSSGDSALGAPRKRRISAIESSSTPWEELNLSALVQGRTLIRSAFRSETTPAAGSLTVLGDAPIAAFAGAVVGCLTTEHFSAFGIAPDIASALTTALVCGLLLVTGTTGLFAGAFFFALYGGTFAGMTPISWLGESAPGALSVVLAIVGGVVFFVVARLDNRSAAPIGKGCGGRFGAVAIVASFLFVELVGPLGVDTSRFHAVAAGAFDVEPWSAVRAFFVCLVGIFLTLYVLRQRGIADGSAAIRIFIASAAALFGLIVLHLGDPDDAAATDAFYAGCFLGMSTPDRLKGWFQPVSGAVVLIVLLVPVRAYLNGFGGGLGLAAFIAVMLLVAVRRATAWMLMGNRSFTTAIASAAIALFLMIGLISAEPLAEDVLVAIDTPASEPTAELSDAASAGPVVGQPAPGAADKEIPIADTAPPSTAGQSAARIPDAGAEDEEALFREFVQYRSHVTLETSDTASPQRATEVRTTARDPHIHSQAAASGPRLLFPPLAGGGAVRPRQTMVRRTDFGDRQKKPAPKSSLQASRQDRQTAASAAP
jgi:hypothetical protein